MISDPWRLVFFGTPPFSVVTLEHLMQGPDRTVAVVTQPDREKGRGRRIVPSPVKELALQHDLLLLQPERLKEESFCNGLKALKPDLYVVIAYGKILPRSLLDLPKQGAVNVHASILPAYRGASPIARAILNGERKTGVTTMLMDEGMDTGDILLQQEVSITERDTGETLHDRLAQAGARLLMETIEKMKAGGITPIRQDHTKATYAPPLKKEDGRIDWGRKAVEIDRQVRALMPWPGAFTSWGERTMKIWRGRTRQSTARGNPGRVAWVGTDFIEVETGEGLFLLEELQLEGKRRMAVKDFLAGHSIDAGMTLGI